MNLRNKSILGVVLILSVVLGVNATVLMKDVTGRYKSALLSKTIVLGEGLKREINKTLQLGLPLEGLEGVNERLKRTVDENKDVGYTMIVDSKGRILFHNDSALIGKTVTETAGIKDIKTEEVITRAVGDYYETALPLFDPEQKLVGSIRLALKGEEVMDQVSSMLLRSITVLGIGFIVAIGLVALFITRFITRPITTITSTALEIAHGDFTKTIEISFNDELGELGEAINRMIQSLSEILKRFSSAAMDVSMAAEQIAIDSKKMAEGARNQSGAVEKTATSVEEMNLSIKEIASSTVALSTSAEQTSSSILEISSSIEEVAQGASVLSGSISEVTSSIERSGVAVKEVAGSLEALKGSIEETGAAAVEIDRAVRTVVDNVKESARLAEKVFSDASGVGVLAIADAINGMAEIEDSVRKASDGVNRLGQRSIEIGKITTVIDDITAKTNLLALNAAILAAQAGEHGKGFSVVAEEIRDLAEKTASSTKEIANLIKATQKEAHETVETIKDGLKKVDEGRRLVDKVGDALREIIHSSERSQEAAEGIEGATIEQAKGVRQVAEAVERVKDMIGQIAMASQHLRKETEQIVKAMETSADISKHLKKATAEQSRGSKQIRSMSEDTADRTRLISRATEELRLGSETIFTSMNEVRAVAIEGMEIASEMDLAMESLRKEAEGFKKEIERFKIR